MLLLSSPLSITSAYGRVDYAYHFVRDFGNAAEHLKNDFALSQFVCSALAYYALPFPERGEGGQRRWGCRDLQTISGSVCGGKFVTLVYFVSVRCSRLDSGPYPRSLSHHLQMCLFSPRFTFVCDLLPSSFTK